MTTAGRFYSVGGLAERENLPQRGNIPTLAAGVQAPHGCAGDANSRKGGRAPPPFAESIRRGTPKEKEPRAKSSPVVPFDEPVGWLID